MACGWRTSLPSKRSAPLSESAMEKENPGPGATGTGAGIGEHQQVLDGPPSPAAQGWRARSRVVDLGDERFRRDLVQLHWLGPRAYYQMLAELGAQRLIP